MTFSTCDLSDEHADDVRVVVDQLAAYGGREAFSGEAVTVRCTDGATPDNTLIKELAGTPGEGRVLVVDAGGALTHAVLGDLIAQDAAGHGWAGIVIDGAVRDVEVLRGIDLGVRARGSVPRRSVRRGVGERDVVVTIGGVGIEAGDHVYADATGIVVSARALV